MCDQEYYRGKELLNLETDRRVTLKLREDEISALKGEIEHFKHLSSKQLEDQYELKSEIEALKRHVALLNQQNFEVRDFRLIHLQLSTELEKFIETDETIRKTLNRKGKVEEIRYKVDEAIMRSMYEAKQRRSPERARTSLAHTPIDNNERQYSPLRENTQAMTTPFRTSQYY
jgi:hypothetical protein